jgi:hypothetical protein
MEQVHEVLHALGIFAWKQDQGEAVILRNERLKQNCRDSIA